MGNCGGYPRLLGHVGRFLFVLLVSTAPKRAYSVEDFSALITARLRRLESQQDARQRYGSLLAVLRQQVDANRQRKPGQ